MPKSVLAVVSVLGKDQKGVVAQFDGTGHLPTALAGSTVFVNGIPAPLLASIRRRRPDADPAELIPAGWDAARALIEQYVEAGLSKFVVRPAAALPSFPAFIDDFVRELVPLQN